ncbi:SRPBCC domain-containing protein [Gemmobacter fulvus]|uniref:CoxG family protein n=1 Tax=Gemmobacter fulvus TaxID=2840474 RepID=UPI00279678CF|nr:SRPBCC domain-containing protein [Gemmobacter fulvus]MDQ1850751.1 SRPBCC domain-containing protein [Gemmobacter fulvus]
MGPAKATFTAPVILSEMDLPKGYRITGQGVSKMGGATGDAALRLSDTPSGTMLSYDVEDNVTGKIAGLAQRFIEPTAQT